MNSRSRILPGKNVEQEIAIPSRTRGCLGKRDAASPEAFSFLGNTPGTLGVRDSADPNAKNSTKKPKIPPPQSDASRTTVWLTLLKEQGIYLPTDTEGSALPGAGNFPGAGFRYTFRTRPVHSFDLAGKIHDLSCQMNGVASYPVEIFSGTEKTDPKNPFELSRLAKLDRVFYLMNKSVPPPAGLPWLYNKLSNLRFRGGDNYVAKHLAYDGFRNPFLDYFALITMQDPKLYLMIPYDSLPPDQQHKKLARKRKRFVKGPQPNLKQKPGVKILSGNPNNPGDILIEEEVWEPDYEREVPFDTQVGFLAWMKEAYKKNRCWNAIIGTSDASGKKVIVPDFQIY